MRSRRRRWIQRPRQLRSRRRVQQPQRPGTAVRPGRRCLDLTRARQRDRRRLRLVLARRQQPHLTRRPDRGQREGDTGRRGLGAPCTPTTVRSVSRTAGSSGNSEATCVSGPTPSIRTSNVGTAPWFSGPAALASSSAYAEAAASTSVPNGPSEAGIACTRFGSSGTASSRAARACVTLRSGSPSGRKRSSPHQRSSRPSRRRPGRGPPRARPAGHCRCGHP